MTVPGIVQATLEDEEIATRISLGGDDELFVTATATLIYRAEGLLSDESVEEFPHDAERLTLSEGRRKTRFALEYPLEGTAEFTIPAKLTADVLHPVLAGILSGNGITTAGETVINTYRLSELTLILTSERLVKHIGEAIWDEDFEEYHFADVTNLSFEPGNVATQIVMTVDGRPHRIKAPNEAADDIGERLKRALCEYHDIDSLDAFNAQRAPTEDTDDSESDPAEAFGDGVSPLEMGGSAENERSAAAADDTSTSTASAPETPADGGASVSAADEQTTPDHNGEDDGAPSSTPAVESDTETTGQNTFSDSAFESAAPTTDPELLERLEALESTVARQNELLEAHQQTIEQLITELRQGR